VDNGIHFKPLNDMIKSFSFSLDSEFDVEEISNMENITYDESNGIIFKLIEDHHINCGERTEGSVTFDDSVTPIIYNVDYRFCLEVGEDWNDDVWDEFEVNVQL
jgi:transcription initiation factor IIE alpha subunit